MDLDPPLLTVAIPVKNGEARLLETLEQVAACEEGLKCRCEVIVVDDGSTDGTPRILADFASNHPYVCVLRHEKNRGKGAALKTAVERSRGDFVLTLDGDASYSLEPLPAYLEAVQRGYALAIGNRRDPRTRFVLHPGDLAYVGRRHFFGWVFGWLARRVAGVAVADCQAGFKLYRGEVARKLFATVEAERFGFDVEILALARLEGYRVAELPVVYLYKHQPSTVKLLRDGLRMLRRLFLVRAKVRRRVRRTLSDHTRGDYQRLAREKGHPIQRFWHGQKWRLVAATLGVQKADRVLDAGAGSSEIANRLRGEAAFVCATDLSIAPLLFMARTGRSQERDGNDSPMAYVAADLHALPYQDASFDRVVLLEVIEHLPPDRVPRCLGELRRVLAPGGKLLLTTPNYRSIWPVLEWLVDHFGGAAPMGGEQHICRFHPEKLRRALTQNGFRVVREGTVYHLSPFLAPLAAKLANRVYSWELRRGGRLGPIVYSVAEADS